jgi:hypothetical protein
MGPPALLRASTRGRVHLVGSLHELELRFEQRGKRYRTLPLSAL